MSNYRFFSCFDILEVPRSLGKWNCDRLSFLPFIFIFEQCGGLLKFSYLQFAFSSSLASASTGLSLHPSLLTFELLLEVKEALLFLETTNDELALPETSCDVFGVVF